MENTIQKLSNLIIIAPFFNEEKVCDVFHQSLCQHLDSLNIVYHLIYVDDGSKDNTKKVIEKLNTRGQEIKAECGPAYKLIYPDNSAWEIRLDT